jgi:hypothetical protein
LEFEVMTPVTTVAAPTENTIADMRTTMRRMVAVLQAERQALAALDLEGILATALDKRDLCDCIDPAAGIAQDAECRGLLETAKRLNEANRQVRNLLAANVSARLEALTGFRPLYDATRPTLRVVPAA